jgi:hypothetical protein
LFEDPITFSTMTNWQFQTSPFTAALVRDTTDGGNCVGTSSSSVRILTTSNYAITGPITQTLYVRLTHQYDMELVFDGGLVKGMQKRRKKN